MSKTFRKFPEIVVHPPENVTASMPDITVKIDSYTLNNCTVNENNLSCPDLADETIYAAYNPLNKSFDSCSSYASYDDDHFDVFSGVEFNLSPIVSRPPSYLRELRDLQTKFTPKRRITNPSDILKKKLKQSASMQNLFSTPVKQFDNYHTIHSSSNLCSGYPDFALGVARCSSFDGSLKKSERKKEIINKCCCGLSRCKVVVPIQQYLETYFDQRVSEKRKERWFWAVVIVDACSVFNSISF